MQAKPLVLLLIYTTPSYSTVAKGSKAPALVSNLVEEHAGLADEVIVAFIVDDLKPEYKGHCDPVRSSPRRSRQLHCHLSEGCYCSRVVHFSGRQKHPSFKVLAKPLCH